MSEIYQTMNSGIARTLMKAGEGKHLDCVERADLCDLARDIERCQRFERPRTINDYLSMKVIPKDKLTLCE